MEKNQNQPKTKQCKYCKATVNKKSKKCPFCGRRLSMHPLSIVLISILAVLVAVLVAFLAYIIILASCIVTTAPPEKDISSLSSSSASSTSSSSSTSSKTPKQNKSTSQEQQRAENPGPTVYVTNYGKRYHYNSHCNGGHYGSTTLQNALKMGLTPCQKCVG